MKIVPFEPGHLARIAPGRFDALAAEGLDPDIPRNGAAVPGPALSFMDPSGAVLGAAGIVPLWRGVGTAWVYASDALRAHPVAFHRAVSRGLALAERALRLHRVEISVHPQFHQSLRWVERLGFRFEGEMPGYGPNGDGYLRYAKVNHHVGSPPSHHRQDGDHPG